MVKTDDVRQLWQYYDDQSKTPFIGATQAKKFATRLRMILDAPNKQKLLMILPKEPAILMRMVRGYSEENWHLMMMTGEMPRDDVQDEPSPQPEPTCNVDDEDPFEPPKVRWEFDKREARWIVYVDYQQVMKRVGVYVYKEQAKVVAHSLSRNKPEQLRELWKVL